MICRGRTFILLATGLFCFWHIGMPPLSQLVAAMGAARQKYTPSGGSNITPLMQAVMGHDLAKVQALIIAGVDVNADTEGHHYPPGETALMIAAAQGSVDIMQALIAAGASVHADAWGEQPWAGRPVVCYAIDSGLLEAVTALIKAGAQVDGYATNHMPSLWKGDINIYTAPGMRNIPILVYAIRQHASPAIIEALIRAGANVNKGSLYNHTHWTPLMAAAYWGYEEALSLLLKAGARTSIRNEGDEGKMAIDYARERGNTRIVEMLS